MKTITKLSHKIGLAASVFCTLSLLLVPASTVAMETRAAATNSNITHTTRTSPFCSNVANDANGINSRLSGLRTKVTQAWAQQDQRLSTDEQHVDSTVAADRQKADTERVTDFASLEKKANTSTKLSAVKTYESSVKDAVSTRRAAYDSAREVFRTSLKTDIANRRSSITGQLNTFQASVNVAISTAEASCSSNPSEGSTTRTTFVSSLKSARETFQSQRSADEKIKLDVQQLASTRDAAFNTAEQTFKSSLTLARQTLEQAFGKNSGSI